MKRKYTHYGWFSFCPVKLGNLEGDTLHMAPRWPWLEWLLMAAVEVQSLAILVCTYFNPSWDPTWKVRVTSLIPTEGELE